MNQGCIDSGKNHWKWERLNSIYSVGNDRGFHLGCFHGNKSKYSVQSWLGQKKKKKKRWELTKVTLQVNDQRCGKAWVTKSSDWLGRGDVYTVLSTTNYRVSWTTFHTQLWITRIINIFEKISLSSHFFVARGCTLLKPLEPFPYIWRARYKET